MKSSTLFELYNFFFWSKVVQRKRRDCRYRCLFLVPHSNAAAQCLYNKSIKTIFQYPVKTKKYQFQFMQCLSDTDETLGLGSKVSVSGPIPGLGLGLGLDLGHF